MVLVWRCHACLPNVLGLLLEFWDDCSCAGRRLSLLEKAIITLNFVETGGIAKLVGSNVLLRKPARMRVAPSAIAGVLSALTPLLIKKTGLLLSKNRQASER